MKTVLFPGMKIIITAVHNGFVVASGSTEPAYPVAIAENLLDIGTVLNEYFTLPTLEDQPDVQESHDDGQGSRPGEPELGAAFAPESEAPGRETHEDEDQARRRETGD